MNYDPVIKGELSDLIRLHAQKIKERNLNFRDRLMKYEIDFFPRFYDTLDPNDILMYAVSLDYKAVILPRKYFSSDKIIKCIPDSKEYFIENFPAGLCITAYWPVEMLSTYGIGVNQHIPYKSLRNKLKSNIQKYLSFVNGTTASGISEIITDYLLLKYTKFEEDEC